MSKRAKPKPLFTQTVTPADSEEEDSPPIATTNGADYGIHNGGIALSVHSPVDTDMDMGNIDNMPSPRSLCPTTDMMPSPKASPRTLIAPIFDALGIQDSANTGRLPTPIYGHFQQCLTNSTPGDAQASVLPTKHESGYEQVPWTRMMPSPISEDEAMEFPPLQKDQPPQIYDSDSPRLRTPIRMVQPLATQSPQRGKIMFSMGFRADCDLCRQRVPGHTNHIFRA